MAAPAVRALPQAVTIDDDRGVVGAQWEAGFSGKAYVVRRDGSDWVLEQELLPGDLGRFDHFGASIALAGDFLFIGAPWQDRLQGTVYVFARKGDQWVQRDKLIATDSRPDLRFGQTLSIEGGVLLVGARGEVAYEFELADGDWSQRGKTFDLIIKTTAIAEGSGAAADRAVIAEFVARVSEPYSGSALAANDTLDWVNATDGVFEEYVEVTWDSASQDNIVYKITRDEGAGAETLTMMSSDDRVYQDTTAQRGQVYSYCVVIVDMLGVDGPPKCDDGSRIVRAPANVAASDGEFIDGVHLTWNDRSAVEVRYLVYRDGGGSPILFLGPNQTSAVDVTAVAGTVYTYEVEAQDADFRSSLRSGDDGFRGTVLPPFSLSATDGEFTDRVVLNWQDQSSDEVAYVIFRDGLPLDTVSANSVAYVDSNLAADQVYDYSVQTEGPGAAFSIAVHDSGGTLLPAPINIQATDATLDDRVEITWTDASGFADGYEVLRDAALLTTVGAGIRLFRDETANLGATYNYCVRAVADGGGVSAEACDTGSRSIVLAPTGVIVTAGTHEDRTEISWQSTATEAVLFKVYRDNIFIKSVSGSSRSYGDLSGTAGRIYNYKVEAVTTVGNIAASVEVAGHRALGVPTVVSASDDGFEDRVDITWSDNSQVENGFAIYRATAVDTVLIGERSANINAFTDRTGVPGTVYSYGVAAFDTTGEARGESVISYDPGARALLPPTVVQATDGEFETRIEISWEDNSNAEDGYRIYRDAVLVGTTADNVTDFVDTAALVGTASYSVAAFDGLGESEGIVDEGSTTILAPVSLNASDIYAGRIELKWVDNSVIEDGYHIYRDGLLYQTTAANVSAFSDGPLTVGATYSYEVEAFVSASGASSRTADEGTASAPLVVPILDEVGGKITSSSVFADARFGWSIATAGDFAIVGAPTAFNFAGAAYIFKREPDGSWVEEAVLRNDTTAPDQFGWSVGISAGRAVVGAPADDDNTNVDTGAAYFYSRAADGTWTEDSKVLGTAELQYYGYSVAIDNRTAVIGQNVTYLAPKVDVYLNSTVNWNFLQQLNPTGGSANLYFGRCVAIDGDRIAVGAPNALASGPSLGAAYIFERTSSWFQVANVIPTGNGDYWFGTSISLDGDVAAIGSTGENSGTGAVYLVERDGSGDWGQSSGVPGLRFETARIAADDGDMDDGFGTAVSVSNGRVVAGAVRDDDRGNNAGSAYIFARDQVGDWAQMGKIYAKDAADSDVFGVGAALSGDRVFIGAIKDDDQGEDSGSVYSFYAPAAPSNVAASDGTVTNRVLVSWQDDATDEDGYVVYRDGVEIANLAANATFYNDTGAAPGRTYSYAVAAARSSANYESLRVSDLGWQPTNGNITGRVNSQAGSGVPGVRVVLEPAPGRALLLDGVGGHLTMADHGEFDFTANDNFTIESWFRYSGSDRQPRIISHVDPADTEGPRTFDLGFQRATGSLFFVVSDGTNAARVITNSESLNDDAWHQVSAVFDATDDSIRVYVDGVFEGSESTAGLGDITNASDITIGGFAADSWFGGQLDEMRIWGVARTQAEIEASWNKLLNGDEVGLLAYWPMDVGVGNTITDFAAERATYGLFVDGVYWATDVAPVDASALTDAEGSFVISGIRYGNESSFRVRPTYGAHDFSPATLPVNLSTESPVWNDITFADVTAFAVSGEVRFADTECFVPEVVILVDGEQRGTSDKNGKFSVAMDAGDHTIAASFEGHTFSALYLGVPQPSDVVTIVGLEADRPGIEFVDTTLSSLSGRASGGCDRFIGDIIINLRSENECFALLDTITAGESAYAFSVPPQKYFASATIENIDPGLVALGLRADILSFYQNLGEREIDLSAVADTTLDFVYRAPLSITITERDSGLSLFAAYGPAGCGPEDRLQLEDGTLLPAGLPVIPQLTELFLTISVAENYGPGDQCPLDAGTVTIFDEIFDRQDEPFTIEVDSLGQAQLRTFTSTPSLLRGRTEGLNDRSYQKSLRVSAEAAGRSPVSATEWVLVSGHLQEPGAEFVSIPIGDVPLVILRDPPGDGSFAYLEEHTGLVNTISWDTVTFGGGAGLDVNSQFGFKAQTFIGLGAGVILGIKGVLVANDKFIVGQRNLRDDKTQIAIMTAERLTTEDGQERWWSGIEADLLPGEGDLYIGAGVNLLFSRVGRIGLEGCQIQRTSSIGFEPDSIRTTFAFTERHIREVMMSDLAEAAASHEAGSDSNLIWLSRRDLWQTQLDNNTELKRNAVVTENRSFSAGAGFEYTSTTDTTASTLETSTTYFTNTGELGLASSVNDIGTHLLVTYEAQREDLRDFFESTSASGVTIGYSLGDDDAGDSFSVDIMNDGVNQAPAFEVRAGRSSCPYEPWPDDEGAPSMVQRDRPTLTLGGANELIGVPPEEAAVFALQIGNLSDEARDYTVSLVSNSNPGGAIVRLNGSPIENGLTFSIDGNIPGASNVHEATLSVERGPSRFSYPDLEVVVIPACGSGDYVSDAVTFSVTFEGCSDVRLSGPAIGPGWSYTQQNSMDLVPLDLVLDRYELVLTPPNVVAQVGVQYRRLGTGQNGPGPWVDIASSAPGTTDIYDNGDQSPDTIFPWIPGLNALGNPELLEDGVYELRGYTDCSSGGRGYSDVVTGTIDRSTPLVFGTPEPSDQQLSLGEDIQITFNEPMQCSSVDPDSVTLRYLDGPNTGQYIVLTTVCNGSSLILEPNADSTELEGRRLEARVAAMMDLAGNPMTARTWNFDYRQSLFTWSQTQIIADAPLNNPGSLAAEIVNGTPTAIDYAVTEFPAFLTGVSPATGQLISGERLDLALEIDPAQLSGVYAGEITIVALETATTDTVGTAVLDVTVDISCGGAPAWQIEPGDFEHSMTVVAQIEVDGSGVPFDDPNDRVAAFVGEQLRGVANVGDGGVNSLAFVTVYGNVTNGETVRFEVWDDDVCALYASTLESLPFVAGGTIGTVASPQLLTATNVSVAGVFELSAGWNWFSTNVLSASMAVGDVLSSLQATEGDVIKSKTAFATYDPVLGWTGALTTLDNVSGYMVRLAQPGSVYQFGTDVDPALTPVPLTVGWNWIGYTPNFAQDIGTALTGLEPLLDGDEIAKGQSQFAQWNAPGWVGNLSLMSPGHGYRLELDVAALPGSFTYTESMAAATQVADFNENKAKAVGDGPDTWNLEHNLFQYNMAVVAVLHGDQAEWRTGEARVGAFVNGECRGLAKPVHVPGVNRYLAFLTVHSNVRTGEEVTLMLLDSQSKVVYDTDQEIEFTADTVNGTLKKPLAVATTGVSAESLPKVYRLGGNFPNPFNPTTQINFELPQAGHVVLKIFDVRGQLVKTLADATFSPGRYEVNWNGTTNQGARVSSGVYFYRIQTGAFVDVKKMVLLK